MKIQRHSPGGHAGSHESVFFAMDRAPRAHQSVLFAALGAMRCHESVFFAILRNTFVIKKSEFCMISSCETTMLTYANDQKSVPGVHFYKIFVKILDVQRFC